MKFVCLVGLPGSGKSLYAQSYCRANPGTVWINPDRMRWIVTRDENNIEEDGIVWPAIRRMTEYLLSIGCSVIADGLNYDRKLRRFWKKMAKKYLYTIECHILRTPYQVCLDRNNKRDRKVPLSVYANFQEKFFEPTLEEGFDKIVNIEYEPNS